jgi:ubiquinone/menaquinone biosynthesis C-methylase UbiE
MREDERDRDFWERNARRYDRVTTGFFGRPLPRALELTASAVSGAERVLEVAAGTGLMTAAIAPRVRHLTAADYSESMLAVLRERMAGAGLSNVEAVHRDIYALGFPPASFDVVVAGNVLHLVPDLERALEALAHVLRPGGTLITPTFAHDETALAWVASRVLANVLGQPMHRRFTAASLRLALERAGLRIVRAETIRGVIPIAYFESVISGSGALNPLIHLC